MESRPGNREKGWNDPPEFLHSSVVDADTTTASNKTKTVLNQRVAHNFDGKVQSQPNADQPKPNEPPKMTAPPLGPPLQAKPTETTAKPSEVDLVSLEEAERILTAKIQHLRDNGCKSGDEIQKRVNMLISAWPKLNLKVKELMGVLVKAIDANELEKANDIHVRLVLDFPSEVVQWMVGIKKLIYELTEANKVLVESN